MNLSKNIEEYDIVFLDLETTGLDVVMGDAICEIGAVKVKNRKIIDKCHSLVNPKKSVPAAAFQVHKISDEQLRDAPFFEKVADDLTNFLQNSLIVAYNVRFDMSFIDHHLKGMGKLPISSPAIDALAMARDALSLSRYNLESVANYFEIDCSSGFHRAMDDAMIVYFVFYKLIDLFLEKDLRQLDEFISLYGFNNEILKAGQKLKIELIKKSIEKEEELDLRFFSPAQGVVSERIMPLRLLVDNHYYNLLYQNKALASSQIRSNRILEVNKVDK